MNRDYTSNDQKLDIDPFKEMENEFRNSNDGLYIVDIKNGEAKVFKIPEEEKALKDILLIFKSFAYKFIEKR